jgi:hypothetical protein
MEFNAQWVTRALRLAAGRASGHGTLKTLIPYLVSKRDCDAADVLHLAFAHRHPRDHHAEG